MDPFSTLGLAPSYQVDLPAIERRYRELSRALHPDKFVGAGASERRAALSKAVEVNEAWRIVRDPVRRAEALLELKGVRIGEDRRDSAGDDPAFLMEMLEQREALAEAKERRDLLGVRRMAAAVEGQVAAVERELAARFASGEGEPLAGKLGELRFYKRFLEEASAIEDTLTAAVLRPPAR